MKKQLILVVTMIALLSLGLTSVLADGDETNYGAAGAAQQTTYTLEEMLLYAIQDETLALTEYEYLINELGADRPFTNIIKSEQNHIDAIVLLYETYGIEVPVIDPSGLLYLPATIVEALEIGVQAEIDNIAMYETFLSQDLPDDVRDTFENLMAGSESHLAAFQNSNGQQGGGNQGNGRGRNNSK